VYVKIGLPHFRKAPSKARWDLRGTLVSPPLIEPMLASHEQNLTGRVFRDTDNEKLDIAPLQGVVGSEVSRAFE
jgi:hypothetical protein